MALYETTVILKPTLADPEVAQVAEKTKQTISGEGGELINHEVWGRRKLTHAIGKAREGVYVYFKFKSGIPLVNKLNRDLTVSENVLRHMTLLVRERRPLPLKKKKERPAAGAAPAAPVAKEA